MTRWILFLFLVGITPIRARAECEALKYLPQNQVEFEFSQEERNAISGYVRGVLASAFVPWIKFWAPWPRVPDLSEAALKPNETAAATVLQNMEKTHRTDLLMVYLAQKLSKNLLFREKFCSSNPQNIRNYFDELKDGLKQAAAGLNDPDSWFHYSERLVQQLQNYQAGKGSDYWSQAVRRKIGAFMDQVSLELLPDAKKAFEKKEQLIRDARHSVYLMSWALFDDRTGGDWSQLLQQKKKAGLDVRIIVDGTVALRSGTTQFIHDLEKSGIPVVYWSDPNNPLHGQHRKLLLIDDTTAIIGGRNIGSSYAARMTPDKNYSDYEVLIKGPQVLQARELFVRIWTQQVNDRRLATSALFPTVSKESYRVAPGPTSLLFLNSDPLRPNGAASPISEELILAIRSAQKEIYIEHSYFAPFNAIRLELEKAIDRGVKVLIVTNSADSTDEPLMSAGFAPEVDSLAQRGALVYLQHVGVLHSKVVIIDKEVVFVKSYNLHPRSERGEGELAVVFRRPDIAAQIQGAFFQSRKNGTLVDYSTDAPATLFGTGSSTKGYLMEVLTHRLFYNIL